MEHLANRGPEEAGLTPLLMAEELVILKMSWSLQFGRLPQNFHGSHTRVPGLRVLISVPVSWAQTRFPSRPRSEVRRWGLGLYLGPFVSPCLCPEGWCLWYFRAAETSKGGASMISFYYPGNRSWRGVGLRAGLRSGPLSGQLTPVNTAPCCTPGAVGPWPC